MPLHRIIILMAVAGAASADNQAPAALTPAQGEEALRLAEATGLAMFRHDQAAAVATDVVWGRSEAGSDERLRGWVTEERDGIIVVTFIGAPPGEPTAALYRVEVSVDERVVGDPEVLPEPEPLTPFESAAAAARETAVASGFEPCAERYNTVVLPVGGNPVRGWVVYLLPATTRSDVVPLGGTYRLELDPEGKTVTGRRAFTKTCISLPLGESEGRKVAALTVSHLLDPIPTEAHVFWSLWSGVPFFVLTSPGGTVWGIEDGAIRLLERRK